jgi:hypothetical protein
MAAFVLIFILFVLQMLKDHHWFMAFIGCLTLLWVCCGRSWRNPRLWWWL